MTGWKDARLGEFIELKRGYDLPKHKRTPGVHPVISSSGPSGWNSEARVSAPGVVTGRYGTIGEVFYVTDDFWPLNTTLYVCDFKGNDPQFVSYFLRKFDFRAYSDKAAVPGVNRNALHEALVSFPPLENQRAIAGVLGALDDKIELNRRMNETLEALARTAFDRVKSAGGAIAELGDHVDIIRGRSYKSSELGTSKNALVSLKSFARGGGYRSDGLKPYSGEFNPAQIVAPGEIVVACTDVTQAAAVIGRPALVFKDPRYENLIASLDLVIVRPKEPLSVAFVYFLLSDGDFTEHAYAHATGTTVLHLDRSCIPSYEFTLPSADVVAEFDRAAQPLLDRAAANHGESRTLAELRDTLLPKLISGELRVRDAEEAGYEDRFRPT